MVRGLQDRGIDNVVACGKEGTLAEGLRDAGLTVEIASLPGPLAERRRAQLRGIGVLATVPPTLLYAFRILRLTRRQHIDVIHTNSMKAHVGGMLAGWVGRIPVVAHIHDDLTQLHTGAGVSGLVVRLLRRVPVAVVGCSRHVLDVVDLGGVPSAVVYSGVPANVLSGSVHRSEGDPVVGMVARIAEWKGQHLFLDAAQTVARSHPGVRFRIVGTPMFGEDAYLERLRARAATGVLAGRVEFPGYVADPMAEYDRFTVAVACSVEPEPFGQVVVEAMARGCAVVAPAEGGPLEVITPEVDGILVPPRDAEALSSAILRLLHDEPLRSLLGTTAVETVKARFTVEVMAEAFATVLAEVAAA
jgi:glycosyltransferase involved in cell wall biosynthesis